MKAPKILILAGAIGLLAAGCGSQSTTSGSSQDNPPMQTQSAMPDTSPTSSMESGVTQNINISNFAFDPPSITIAPGTTVTWTNQDSVAHTVTGDNVGLASGHLAKGQSYSFTFNQAGTFTYHCSIHPTMKGTVIVTP